jgi:HPt (histidine-containing phosphotransfer) domain-containing protein
MGEFKTKTVESAAASGQESAVRTETKEYPKEYSLPSSDLPGGAARYGNCESAGQLKNGQEALANRRPVIDMSVLDSIRTLQRAGTPDLIGELATLYVSEAQTIMKTLGSAVDEKNTQDMFRLAHKLKSSSANLGAMHLSGLLKSLELLGRQNEVEGTADLFAHIQKEFEAVQEALKPLIPERIV